MSTIKVVKLINGDELIGKTSLNKDGSINFENPRQVAMMQTGPQQMGIALVPWLASNIDGTITVNKEAMMTDLFDASNELEKQYLQQISGIAIASAIQK